MKKNKALNQELIGLKEMLNVVDTYEEIAALRMRKVKNMVFSSREFLGGLNDTFSTITYAYEAYLKGLRNKKARRATKNGKSVVIFLSSNTGLYGDIVQRTFDLFRKDLQGLENMPDIVVVGKIGMGLMKKYLPDREFSYHVADDSGVTEKHLQPFLDEVLEYSQIAVYHGFFSSVMEQEPRRTVITGSADSLKKEHKSKDGVSFMIEPSVEEVADYFENQILAALIEQADFEMSLSKFSSRMVSLYSSSQNIKSKIEEVGYDLRKFKHIEINKKQITVLSGADLWR
jgi:F0F1-type ATP synthase gamma subunit